MGLSQGGGVIIKMGLITGTLCSHYTTGFEMYLIVLIPVHRNVYVGNIGSSSFTRSRDSQRGPPSSSSSTQQPRGNPLLEEGLGGLPDALAHVSGWQVMFTVWSGHTPLILN